MRNGSRSIWAVAALLSRRSVRFESARFESSSPQAANHRLEIVIETIESRRTDRRCMARVCYWPGGEARIAPFTESSICRHLRVTRGGYKQRQQKRRRTKMEAAVADPQERNPQFDVVVT